MLKKKKNIGKSGKNSFTSTITKWLLRVGQPRVDVCYTTVKIMKNKITVTGKAPNRGAGFGPYASSGSVA